LSWVANWSEFRVRLTKWQAGPALEAGTANVVSWARESVESRETSPQLFQVVLGVVRLTHACRCIHYLSIYMIRAKDMYGRGLTRFHSIDSPSFTLHSSACEPGYVKPLKYFTVVWNQRATLALCKRMANVQSK
jgi:hypothetical protein